MTEINSQRPLGWTTLEEARQLVEAGLPAETADMLYTSLDGHTTPWVWASKPGMHPEDVPCWSLGALMQLLPRMAEQGYDLIINPQFYVIYINPFSKDVKFVCDMSSFLIENVKDAIIWRLKNKLI